MDVFELRERLIEDYGSYVRSFIRVRDPEIRRRVDEELDGGLLWPEPLIQLNPAFEPGEYIDDLVTLCLASAGRWFPQRQREARMACACWGVWPPWEPSRPCWLSKVKQGQAPRTARPALRAIICLPGPSTYRLGCS